MMRFPLEDLANQLLIGSGIKNSGKGNLCDECQTRRRSLHSVSNGHIPLATGFGGGWPSFLPF